MITLFPVNLYDTTWYFCLWKIMGMIHVLFNAWTTNRILSMDGNDVYKINFELPYNFNCDIQQTEVNWILFKVFPLGDAD